MTQELRRLAEAATQGEWKALNGTVYELRHYGWKKGEELFENRWSANIQTPFDQKDIAPNIAAYIAAANPAAIISLLDRLEKAEKDAENMYSNMCRAQQEAEHLYRSRYESTRQEAEHWRHLYEATMEAIAKQAWATTPSPIFITNPVIEASK